MINEPAPDPAAPSPPLDQRPASLVGDGDDWEWRAAADDSPEELVTQWTGAVARSRAAVADALASDGLDTLAASPTH